MDSPLSNVLLHLPERPRDDAVAGLAQALARLPGVGRVARGLKLPSVVLVHYDPAHVSAETFVHMARRRGLVAQLVGM